MALIMNMMTMMNREGFAMALNQIVRNKILMFGMIISFIWIGLSSFVYFENIENYSRSQYHNSFENVFYKYLWIEQYFPFGLGDQLGYVDGFHNGSNEIMITDYSIFGDYTVIHAQLYNHFNWVKDIEGTDIMHAKKASLFDLVLMKPTFKLSGYLKIIFYPLMILFFGLNFLHCIWRRRRVILIWLLSKFNLMNWFTRYSCGVIFILGCIILYTAGVNFFLAFIGVIGMAPLLLYIVKSIVYVIFYAATKAIEDAKKN